MENNDYNILQDSFNEQALIKKNNKVSKFKKIHKSNKNRSMIMEQNYKEDKSNNFFRKNYMNDKIRNPKINRTLNDIYDTINSINTINKKIYKIFYKRKNTKENTNNSSNNSKNVCVKNRIINEYKQKQNKPKAQKRLKRAHYSYDNIMSRNDYPLFMSSVLNDDKNHKFNKYPDKIDDRSILYVSSYISEELNKNKINNKLNYDYNDLHLRDKLNKYKNKLKRNQTCDNILDINYFRNSKNIKDIIMLEKCKQNEFQKLENIKTLKKKYFNKSYIEKQESKSNNFNNKTTKNKPFCFNDNIEKIKNDKNKNNYITIKNDNVKKYFNKIFSINKEKENNRNNYQDIFSKNYNTDINKNLNFNYEIYRNIIHN